MPLAPSLSESLSSSFLVTPSLALSKSLLVPPSLLCSPPPPTPPPPQSSGLEPWRHSKLFASYFLACLSWLSGLLVSSPSLGGAAGTRGTRAGDWEGGKGPPWGEFEGRGKPAPRGGSGEKQPVSEGERGLPGPRGDPGPPGESGPMGAAGPAGECAVPPRSAFSAKRSESRVPPPADTPLPFDRVLVNEQGHYDPATGKFTCQVPGLYYFAVHATVYRASLQFDLVKNGESVASFFQFFGGWPKPASLSGGALVRLEPEDQVWVQVGVGDYIGIYASVKTDSTFSGFLVYSDWHSSPVFA
ncbi:complement C1q tumor necrosis factor-related protein 5 isoform X1 [Monodelphis domestica]|uniref:C1q and TNF related 5 n=1 Tax=Monodelphis domestica TaxID=13616 RepID=A0A5F8HDG9_MONDO|nr:complement C1q tumor necrosis factor-related protein 5 isoform X1 [Monodelphis domestica]